MNRYNHEHDCPFEVYVTPLKKLQDCATGEWIKFPTSAQELEVVSKRIGIGETDEFGQINEEWFIVDYDVYIDGLYDLMVYQKQSLESLNLLAKLIVNMDDVKYSSFCKKLYDEDICDFQKTIELAQNISNA